MRPRVLNIEGSMFNSFQARLDTTADVNSDWHRHSAVELIYFKRGSGTQFIGNSVKPFNDGDIILIGRNLPHYWRFSKNVMDHGDDFCVEVYVIHFEDNFWGDVLPGLPEFREIRKVLADCKRGLQIIEGKDRGISSLIRQIVKSAGAKRISLLIDCLSEISVCKQTQLLTTAGFHSEESEAARCRLQSIYNYTFRNYKKKIDLREIAEVANLHTNSFCRLFKENTGKTYMQFLSEVRVGKACKLLIENNLNVKEICYESGFLNFASFHRTFRNITGKTPLAFQKSFN